MLSWAIKQNDRNFWLEASFLTRWGGQQVLREAHFVRSPHDFNGLKSYIRFWPDGIYAVARIHPRMSASRVKVTISYYDNRGKKFRELPITRK